LWVRVVVACLDQHVIGAVGDHVGASGPRIRPVDGDPGAAAGEAVRAAAVGAAANDGAGGGVVHFKLNLVDAIGVNA